MSQPERVTRRVVSEDPSLSPEANRLLTQELRAVIGHDSVEVDSRTPDHLGERHATHTATVAGAIEVRLMLVMIGLILAMVALIAVVVTEASTPVVVAAAVLLVPLVIVVALVVNRMADEPEHVSPELGAVLSREGVGDPDRTFTDLVHDFQAPRGRTPVSH